MKSHDIEKIIEKIEDQTGKYDIDVDYDVNDDEVIAKLSGSFAKGKAIEMRFFVEPDSGDVYYSDIADIDVNIDDIAHFWITVMNLICDA